MKKIITILFLVVFLTGCGYTVEVTEPSHNTNGVELSDTETMVVGIWTEEMETGGMRIFNIRTDHTWEMQSQRNGDYSVEETGEWEYGVNGFTLMTDQSYIYGDYMVKEVGNKTLELTNLDNDSVVIWKQMMQ
ncbi:hypothetical protein C0581_01295 [Candidatus Parcubacteria bacterium]|mgnify:CR=1 FL=1|nr:MAG: hypothetical protein C0581_01295 [Candidatus Parcubacteria bacterium]